MNVYLWTDYSEVNKNIFFPLLKGVLVNILFNCFTDLPKWIPFTFVGATWFFPQRVTVVSFARGPMWIRKDWNSGQVKAADSTGLSRIASGTKTRGGHWRCSERGKGSLESDEGKHGFIHWRVQPMWLFSGFCRCRARVFACVGGRKGSNPRDCLLISRDNVHYIQIFSQTLGTHKLD